MHYDQIQNYLPQLISFIVSLHLVVGTYILFKSHRSGSILGILITSLIALTGSSGALFCLYKLHTNIQRMTSTLGSEQLQADIVRVAEKYTVLSLDFSLIYFLGLFFFGLFFAVFCCRNSNLNKRIQQLEELNQTLQEKLTHQ